MNPNIQIIETSFWTLQTLDNTFSPKTYFSRLEIWRWVQKSQSFSFVFFWLFANLSFVSNSKALGCMGPIFEYVIELEETKKMRGVSFLYDVSVRSRISNFPGPLLGQEVVEHAHLVICCRALRDEQFGICHDLLRPFFHSDLHFGGCTQTLRLLPHCEAKLKFWKQLKSLHRKIGLFETITVAKASRAYELSFLSKKLKNIKRKLWVRVRVYIGWNYTGGFIRSWVKFNFLSIPMYSPSKK